MTRRLFTFFSALLVLLAPGRAFALKRLVEVLAVGVTDNSGQPLQNGTVTFYDAGTTTLRTVYADFVLTIPVSNPLTLDQVGRVVVFSDKRIKLLIKDSFGATVRTLDNVGTSDADIAASAVSGGIPSAVPVGVMLAYPGTSAPSGWLMCDGTTVPISQYPGLNAVIGTKFNTGGEATGYFRLPGTARRALIGAGGSGTATCTQGTDCLGVGIANAVGSRGGQETHVLTMAELPAQGATGTTNAGTTGVTVNAGTLPQLDVGFYFDAFNAGTSGQIDSFLQDSTAANGPIFNHIGPGHQFTTGGGIMSVPTGGGSHAHGITDPAHTHSFTSSNLGTSTPHNVVQPSLVTNFIIKY